MMRKFAQKSFLANSKQFSASNLFQQTRFNTTSHGVPANEAFLTRTLAVISYKKSQPTTSEYNSFLHKAVFEHRDSIVAKKLFENMINQNVSPNIETYSYVIGSTLLEPNALRAANYVQSMIDHGVAPTDKLISVLEKVFTADGKKGAVKFIAELRGKSIEDIKKLLPTLRKLAEKQ